MLKTLRSRILFYFLTVSMIGVVVVSLFIQYGFEESFKSYLDLNRERKIDRFIGEIQKEYKNSGNYSNMTVSGLMHEHAMTDQLYFRFYDNRNRLQMDSSRIRGMLNGFGLTEQAGDGEKWPSKSYNVIVDKKIIGKLVAIYPQGYIDDEYTFLQTIQLYIYAAICLTIVLAIVFSLFFSKTLTSGLQKLLFATKELKQHNLNIRIPLTKLPTEVKQLAISFNNLAESLAKEEMLRKQFTHDLAHELRTPLATLRSQIEAYQDGIWDPTPNRLQQSHEELMRLVRLVNELEKLLAAENPQIKLEKIDLEAGNILIAVGEMFQPLFHQKGVNIKIIEPLQEEWFMADKDRLIQILTNILNNALKYTPEGKNVTISVLSDQDDYIGFMVEDQGLGMAEDDIPHVFERFYRGDKSRDRKTGGVGIGLSIVKALMDAHEGRIKVKSKLNKGTSVCLWFPRDL